MKILVTGAAGFIGFHLVEALVKLGHIVVGIDNINDYYDVNLKYARLAESGISRSKGDRHSELASESLDYVLSDKYQNYRFAKIALKLNQGLKMHM